MNTYLLFVCERKGLIRLVEGPVNTVMLALDPP